MHNVRRRVKARAMGFSSRGDFGPEEVAFTTVLRGDSRRFERTHFACTLVLRFKRLERVETTKTQGLSQGPLRPPTFKDVSPQYQLTVDFFLSVARLSLGFGPSKG